MNQLFTNVLLNNQICSKMSDSLCFCSLLAQSFETPGYGGKPLKH